MQTIINIMSMLITVVPFVGLCISLLLINKRKKSRYKQAILPIVAVIYGLGGIFILEKINTIVTAVSDFINRILAFVPVIKDLDPRWIQILSSNILLVGGFIALKIAFFPILTAINANQKIAEMLSGRWYYQSKHDSKFYIKRNAINQKKYILGMYIGAVIVSVILFILAHYISSEYILNSIFYPAFGILILGEIFNFYNGAVEEVSDEVEEGAEEEEHREIDFDKLVEKYEEAFPERLIKSLYNAPELVSKSTVAALIKDYYDEYIATGSQEANIMSRYFGIALSNGVPLDDGMLRQTRSLLDKKSVLFLSLFYSDVSQYIFLPLQRQLMNGKKILVILGRNSSSDSVVEWINAGLESTSNISGLWKINDFSEIDEDTSIGILRTKDIYNRNLLSTKQYFNDKVGLVMLMEPSRLLGTMQIGLSSVISFLGKKEKPQYVAFDRNCDGLVDSLSHVLNTSIENVSATTAGTGRQNCIIWKADGKLMHHKLGLESARYLGVGTELAAVAIREGASNVKWVSSEKFPLVDMKWFVSQYYLPLCTAMKIPVSQHELNKHLQFVPNFWSVKKEDDSLLVVEDEYNNAFESARQFSTRGNKQSLVNVVSSDYWLRAYMCDNSGIFKYDPKAIPNFVADYQRSKPNVVYKILIQLIAGKLPEDDIISMLSTVGIVPDNVQKTLCDLVHMYFFRTSADSPKEIQIAASMFDRVLTSEVTNVFDEKKLYAVKRKVYSIQDKAFIEKFLSMLKVTYYIAEDEADRDKYVGSMIHGLVQQKLLPGVFTTLEGKYYEVVSVTNHNGVLVRRAADHIVDRRYYRQLRTYKVECDSTSNSEGVIRTSGNVLIEHCEARINVHTDGFLELFDYADIEHANRVLISNIPDRNYNYKEVIRIKLEGSDASVRYTVATLLNELFVTVFPDTYEYICATTHVPADYPVKEGLIPVLAGDEDEYIYIIEDSIIDLGLLINVDRYFTRFLEIICDVLDWHNETIESENEQPTPAPSPEDDEPEELDQESGQKKKRKGLFGWIKGIFGRRKKGKPESIDEPSDSDVDDDSENEPLNEFPQDEVSEGYIEDTESTSGDNDTEDDSSDMDELESDKPDADGTEAKADQLESGYSNKISSPFFRQTAEIPYSDNLDDEIVGSDSESVNSQMGIEAAEEEKPYSSSHFLLYGGEQTPDCLNIQQTVDYLHSEGLDDNYMKQTRIKSKNARLRYFNYHFEPGIHYCDFCGCAMESDFDILDDGRERCPECSASAITSLRKFKRLYKDTRREFENIFSVNIMSKITIHMTNATEIAQETGDYFIATKGFDPRTLGFARQSGNKRDLFLENGAPQVSMKMTLVHELSHMWQYENLPDLFDGAPLEHIEGMAVWTEAQYLYAIGLNERAEDYIQCRLHGGTEYGRGLAMYMHKFEFQHDKVKRRKTPFGCSKDPLK